MGMVQVEKDVNKAIALMEDVETEIGRKKEVRFKAQSTNHDLRTFS